MQFYHSNATIIQKVWRGYCSRKHKFDFNKRKAYINEVKRKIVQFREEIAERVKQQRHREKATEMEKFEERIKKLAAVRHHLLSTKAIPGIHNRPRRISHASNVEEEVLHEGERDETAENEGMLIRRNARLGSIMHIPEEKMQTNPVLKDWLQATIGTNHRGINLKPGQVDENEEPRPVEKRAQGPFLPTYALEKKLNRPFRPTLRVQTDFYGVRVHEREERRKEAALRVSDQAFRAGQYIHHPHPDYFLDGEPYRLYSYGSRLFRETEKHRLKGFKSVLPPVEFFDDFSA
ncbi:hypothetical protein BJ742DRAFT_40020 [Cladochytrium replicatum]|nr:hypothetical protein BJ742DRAFT_40020 [Cladochytrium replicatum]